MGRGGERMEKRRVGVQGEGELGIGEAGEEGGRSGRGSRREGNERKDLRIVITGVKI